MRHGLRHLLLCLALGGCASGDLYERLPVAQHLQRADAVGDCARLFQANDILVDQAATRDAQAPRVPGFPYLRVDRLLATLAPPAGASPAHESEWVEALMGLDESARRFELRNTVDDVDAQSNALTDCRKTLAQVDQQQLRTLVSAAQVADDYSSTLRALGLYSLTRYAFAAGIRRWQRETIDEFTAFAEADPLAGLRRHYVVADASHRLPTIWEGPQLGLPLISKKTLADLIARHSPTFSIETISDDDRPGALVWRRDRDRLQITVAVDQPTVYLRTGYAWLGGRWRLQIIYAVWFPARPSSGTYDLLSGRLDGLLWRVTLAEDGSALVYDTIHPCGCYHLFFPTDRVRLRQQAEGFDEGLFIPRALPVPSASARVVLKVAAGTHYLQAVAVAEATAAGIPLAVADDDDLRSLPLPEGGARSAFGADGLIAGSERLERFYFWPMGIRSAGQMRQWGRHATAFVGRRHFDDPLLFDRYFESLP